MKAIVKYKEVGREHIGETAYIGENLTRRFIIEWFGLEEADVEWYEITFE